MKRIDLIKSMAAEELAWEFMVFRFDACCKAKGGESTLPDSQQGILEWLHQEVEELNPVEKILKAEADWYRSLAPLPASVKSALLSGNWDEPKSITRPELPDPPEPETVTFGEYVEITELLDINKLFQICPICDNKTTVIYSQTLGGRDWYECFGCNAIFGIRREEHHG